MKRLILLFAALLAYAGFALAAVNVNSATKEQLETLNGIGPVKAQAIIDYRTKNGPFKSIDDLKKVDGIGDATLEKIRKDVSISGRTTAVADTKAPAKEEKKEAAKPAAAPTKEEKKEAAKPAMPDAKSESKTADPKKTDAKKEEKKAEAKKDDKKADAKKEEPKKEEPKKEEPKKADAKKDAKKEEPKKDEKKADPKKDAK